MKKTMILAVLLLAFVAPSAFAATLDPADGYALITGGSQVTLDAEGAATVADIVKFSKSVYGGAEYNGTGYCLSTGHTSGSKYYGTGYDATAIFVKDSGDVVAGTLEAPADSAASLAFTTADGWSQL